MYYVTWGIFKLACHVGEDWFLFFTVLDFLPLAVRLLILFIIIFGYSCHLYARTKINPAFIPLVVIAAIICYLFIAGLAGVLVPASIVLVVLGCSLAVVYGVKAGRKTFPLHELITPGTVFFIVSCVYFIIFLHNGFYTHYDNFSHWGVALEETLYFDALPDAYSLVTCRTYPPGTTLLAYFVCKIIGYSEGHALIGQSLLIAAALSTLFCNATWKRPLYTISLILTSIIALAIMVYDDGSSHLFNLLVDAVLGFITAGTMLIAYYYRHDFHRSFKANAPILFLLVSLKTSGWILFCATAVLSFILLAHDWRERRKTGTKTRKFAVLPFAVGTIALPVLAAYVWRLYVVNTYTGLKPFEEDKFAFSFGSVLGNMSTRSAEFIQSVPHNLINGVFDITTINGRLFVFLNIVAIIIMIVLAFTDRKYAVLRRGFFFSNAFIAYYIVCLFFLYAAFMVELDAAKLASFYRYYGTAIIVFTMVMLWCILDTLFSTERLPRIVRNLSLVFILWVCLSIVSHHLYALHEQPFQGLVERRAYVSKPAEDARKRMWRYESILWYSPNSNDANYRLVLSTYEMKTLDCMWIDHDALDVDTESLKELLSSKYYVIVTEDLDGFWSVLNSHGIYSENNQFATTYEMSNEGGVFRIWACGY